MAGAVDLAPLADPPEVAGPGFLNVRLRDDWVAADARRPARTTSASGLAPPEQPKTVVIDYSSPNVAKPMHVGHIRSTVIGESLARIFAALGHKVIRDNHLGDWGSQFGMILWGWKNAPRRGRLRRRPRGRAGPALPPGPGPDQGRRQPTSRRPPAPRPPSSTPATPRTAPSGSGSCPTASQALQAVYDRLGVTLRRRSSARASTTRCSPTSSTTCEAKGLAEQSEGATVVFIEGTKAPFIVRKSDGAYNYATTDLATIKYRDETWHPDQILYVVDHRQGDHFKQLFAVARRWGYDTVDLEHVAFGTILGPDRRPFKTREGDVVGLESLLDEAVAEARKVVDENSPDLDPEERPQVAEVVGLGAIKYADLSQNRLSDYVFDWKKMLAMNGNTGAYLQYAYARIRSIFRKGGVDARGDPRSRGRRSS